MSSRLPIFGLPWPDLNDGLYYNDVVRLSDSELTLIEFYAKKHKNSAPYEGWLQRIHNGQISLDGRIVNDPNTIVRAGSELVYHRLPWKEPDAPHSLEVLYEDDDLIALNKPSGLQVLPGGLFQQRTVLTQLQWRKSKQISSRGVQESHPVPVHRLGRGTSGLLLCAKTKLAKTRLAAYFADGTSSVEASSNQSNRHGTKRKITKIYRALASGIIDENKVIINQPIGIICYPGVSKGLYVSSASGKPALSKVEVLERDIQRNSTLVQVEIQSGRPHQIRIHLSFIGHPLLGDPLYVSGGIPKSADCELIDESFAHDGGYERPKKPVPGDCGYYLHAHQVVLSQPTTNQEIKITAPLPNILRSQKGLCSRNSPLNFHETQTPGLGLDFNHNKIKFLFSNKKWSQQIPTVEEEDDRFFDAPEDFPFNDCTEFGQSDQATSQSDMKIPSPTATLRRRRSLSRRGESDEFSFSSITEIHSSKEKKLKLYRERKTLDGVESTRDRVDSVEAPSIVSELKNEESTVTSTDVDRVGESTDLGI